MNARGATPSEDRAAPRLMGPRTKRVMREAQVAGQALPGRLFPQWIRTVLAVLVWLSTVPVYTQLISPYVSLLSAQNMAVGLAMFSGIATHVWPTRTAPWRTVMWAWALSVATGMILLMSGAGPLALTGATIAGFGFVTLRVNENGRKLADLFLTWRSLR